MRVLIIDPDEARAALVAEGTLLSAFLYFDLSFMVWVLLGPLGVAISKDLGLTPSQKGLMVATPLLAGAFLRIVNGVLVDHIGPRRTGMIGQVIVLLGLVTAWFLGVHSYNQVLILGVVLGVAGSSFAVALPLAVGIRPNTRAWRSESPEPEIPARPWRRFSRLHWPRPMAGTP